MHDLTKEFPVLVTMPGAGERYLLRYHSEYQGHRIFLSPTLEGFEAMFKSKLEMDPDSVPTDCYKITFVQPPVEWQEQYAQSQFKDKLNYFKGMLGDLRGSLPKKVKGFTECPEYKKDPEREADAWFPEGYIHYECITPNCVGGLIVPEAKLEELFWANWAYEGAQEPPMKPRKFVSTAPLPKADEPIYEVEEAFGSHTEGLVIKELRDASKGWFYNVNFSFFFQGEKLPLPPAIVKTIADNKKKAKEEQRAQQARQKESRKERDKEVIEDARRRFGLK